MSNYAHTHTQSECGHYKNYLARAEGSNPGTRPRYVRVDDTASYYEAKPLMQKQSDRSRLNQPTTNFARYESPLDSDNESETESVQSFGENRLFAGIAKLDILDDDDYFGQDDDYFGQDVDSESFDEDLQTFESEPNISGLLCTDTGSSFNLISKISKESELDVSDIVPHLEDNTTGNGSYGRSHLKHGR